MGIIDSLQNSARQTVLTPFYIWGTGSSESKTCTNIAQLICDRLVIQIKELHVLSTIFCHPLIPKEEPPNICSNDFIIVMFVLFYLSDCFEEC